MGVANHEMTALIFDLDGTIVDPREGIVRCMRETVELMGADPRVLADPERLIGPPLQEVFATLLDDASKVDQAVTLFRERYGADGLFEAHLYPGMVDALETLRHGHARMFVATSKPREYAVRIVEHFHLTRFFSHVYGSEMSGERADKAHLLIHLLSRENLAAADAVMIGDRKHDIIAARANGLRSVAVTWGFGSMEELSAAGACSFCSSAADLVHCLAGSLAQTAPTMS